MTDAWSTGVLIIGGGLATAVADKDPTNSPEEQLCDTLRSGEFLLAWGEEHHRGVAREARHPGLVAYCPAASPEVYEQLIQDPRAAGSGRCQ